MIDIIKNNKSKITIALFYGTLGVVGRLTLSELLPKTPSLYLNIGGITQPL